MGKACLFPNGKELFYKRGYFIMDSKIKFKIRNYFSNDLENEWAYLVNLCQISVFQTYSWQSIWHKTINKADTKGILKFI